MSWDVDVCNQDNKTVELSQPQHIKGGIYPVGGTRRAEINITYNYGRYYRDFWFESLFELNNMSLDKAIPQLEKAVAALGTETTDNYWQSTAGNAGHALQGLLIICNLAKHEYPDEPLHLKVY